MKKLGVILSLMATMALVYCGSSKNAASKKVAKVTYQHDVQPIIVGSCSPCHIPTKGNKKPYDTYTAVKSDVDEILTRVQKNPGEKGFMPSRHDKLSDSTIQVIALWKKTGLLEK
jgi:cytochrome c553